MNKKKTEEIYQATLQKVYDNMDHLVKAGRIMPGWQKDRSVIRTCKKAAKIMTKNTIKKMEEETAHAGKSTNKIQKEKDQPGAPQGGSDEPNGPQGGEIEKRKEI